MQMKYRKILKAPLHLNTAKNLILRQEWSKRFIQLWDEGNVFYNLDETWLGMSDFRRRKWQPSDTSNSVPSLAMSPRISMLMVVDSVGQSYVSLTQTNSNSNVMEMFLNEFVKKLDRQRPNWRSNSILLLDGASYHKSAATIKIMKELRIPVMFLAPYSYNTAPCELYFAWFKSQDINPRRVPTGAT